MFSLTAKILSTNSATLLTAKALQAALIFAALFNAGASYGQDQANKLDSAAVGQPSSTKEAIVEGNIDNDLVGEQIVANEQTVADEQEREQQELELRDAIEAVEVESGPFDQSLKEPLEDLAELLTAAGEHSEALQLYGRLLHINRINQGLYDDSQF